MSQSRVISEGKTPRQWVEEFRSKGVVISERTLRSKAREKGAFWSLGKSMVLMPEHIDIIFEEPTPKR